jgi:hypothetical protein
MIKPGGEPTCSCRDVGGMIKPGGEPKASCRDVGGMIKPGGEPKCPFLLHPYMNT